MREPHDVAFDNLFGSRQPLVVFGINQNLQRIVLF